MRVKEVWVRRRGSVLLVPFDPPELTIGPAIDRGWERRGQLLLPRPESFLPAYPLPWTHKRDLWFEAPRVQW
jgi:hypothetical protein